MRHVQGGLYQPDGGVHGSYTLEETGNRAICIYCGQCANVCPVDSIVERDECPQVRQAAADPDRVLVVSTSPSVRAALGEEFGMEPGAFVEGKMVALLRALGSRLCAGHQLRRRPDHCGGGQ